MGSEPPGAKYYTLPEKENPRPLLSVTGQDPLWDAVLNTPLRVDDRTNEILSPQALKGFSHTPGIREELLQYLYLSWKLNAQLMSAHHLSLNACFVTKEVLNRILAQKSTKVSIILLIQGR